MIDQKLDLRSGIDATSPPEDRGLERDEVRLLVSDRATDVHTVLPFRTIGEVLREGDVLVVNDSATLPAAFHATRRDGTDVLVHASTSIAADLWTVEPRQTTVTAGEVLALESGCLTMLAPLDARRPRLWYALFDVNGSVTQYLQRHGKPIHYSYIERPFEIARYQTIFARVPGSVEMPSASRPFSPRVVADLHERGIGVQFITLHCGVASLESGERPQAEWFSVPASTVDAVNEAKVRGRRVIASGTSVVRALESATRGTTAVAASGWTDLIITRDNRPKLVDALLSGFHQPDASHVDLLRGFAADAFLRAAYATAANACLRWHEFGDVHLIL